MNWRSKTWLLDWAVPLGFGAALWWLAPLDTALRFGGDEGYELMKGWLASLGHPQYTKIWNDQPPLHTELLGLLFRLTGPSAYAGRLLTLAFAAVLLGALYQVVRAQSGRAAACLAALLVVSSESFVKLSVSVMLEIPAMSLGMAAFWAWSRYASGKGKQWLIIAAALIACALQVKFTAAIFLPALFAEYAAGRRRHSDEAVANGGKSWWRPRWEAAFGLGAFAAAFGIILLAFCPMEALAVFWKSHFSEGTAAAADGYGWKPESLLDDLHLAAGAVAGLALLATRSWRKALAPAVLLGTVLAIHWRHEPYWYYYWVHFSIPMAWLGGVGIVEWFRVLWNYGMGASAASKIRFGTGALAWSAVLSVALTFAPESLWNEVRRVRATPPASEDQDVKILRKHAAGTQWVFTTRRIAAFWAGIPIPPELAVIPSKRVWSGQITREEILERLETYQPEVILLNERFEEEFGLTDYLRAHYKKEPGAGRASPYILRH